MAHDGLGECLGNRGRLDEAIDQFQKALNIAPGYPEIKTNLIIALTRKGRTDEAITHLQTLLKEYPNDAQAQYNLGNALRKKADPRIQTRRTTSVWRSCKGAAPAKRLRIGKTPSPSSQIRLIL